MYLHLMCAYVNRPIYMSFTVCAHLSVTVPHSQHVTSLNGCTEYYDEVAYMKSLTK